MSSITRYRNSNHLSEWHTVSKDEHDTPNKWTLLTWGQFERAKPIFKMLPISLAENMLTTCSRSFCRGTVGVCKGLQSYKLQSWRFIKKSASWLELNYTRAVRVRVPHELIILKVSRAITLLPFDLHRLKVPIWKDLDPVNNIISAQITGSILKICFFLSKWPYFYRAYIIGGYIFFHGCACVTIRLAD